jgi:hypothetical protein
MVKKTLGRALVLGSALLLAAASLGGRPAPARAGCGCDHPLPAWAPVMPSFGYPGSTVRIDGNGSSFKVGTTYAVAFVNPSGRTVSVSVVARNTASIDVTVPTGLLTGPIAIKVTAKQFSKAYGKEFFTALPLPRRVPAGDAVLLVNDYMGAVSSDGTLLIPFDLTDVADPTQFALAVLGKALRFTPADVVFYNKNGFDLTLFTMQVDDPTQRQWGSYYGWDVKTDAGIVQTIYDTKVWGSVAQDAQSDLVTYWRHEFHGYRAAHAPGGSHEVNVSGFHADGTVHVDHDFLILAIDTHGQMKPGLTLFDLLVTNVVSEQPIEPDVMATHVMASQYYVEKSGLVTDLGVMLTGIDWDALDGSTDAKETAETTVVAPDSVQLVDQGLMSAQ